MNTKDQIQFISEKCIAANPEIVELHIGVLARQQGTMRLFLWNRRTWEAADDHRHTIGRSVFSGEILGRPIRLADVLLAMEVNKTFAKQVPSGAYRGSKTSALTFLVGRKNRLWNLRADDLEKQSKETISFLYRLLEGDNQ